MAYFGTINTSHTETKKRIYSFSYLWIKSDILILLWLYIFYRFYYCRRWKSILSNFFSLCFPSFYRSLNRSIFSCVSPLISTTCFSIKVNNRVKRVSTDSSNFVMGISTGRSNFNFIFRLVCQHEFGFFRNLWLTAYCSE